MLTLIRVQCCSQVAQAIDKCSYFLKTLRIFYQNLYIITVIFDNLFVILMSFIIIFT